MFIADNQLRLSDERSSLGSALLILIFTLIGFVIVGPLVGVLVASIFFDGSLFELMNATQPPYEGANIQLVLLVAQAFATTIGLIITPYLFLKIYEKKDISVFFKKQIPVLIPTILTFFIIIVFMGVNAFFIEWNESISFPDFMRGFEVWAQERERLAREATEFLTQFDGYGSFLLGFVTIAILPGIGEELVFRGFLQNYLGKTFKNPHVGVWLAAILFSAIHVQFYGFVPRMLLGALFGYLYLWSGNLLMPILAHFIHNGFTVIMVYLYQRKTVNFDIEASSEPSWYVILVSSVLSFLLIRYFYQFFKNHNKSNDHLEERLQN